MSLIFKGISNILSEINPPPPFSLPSGSSDSSTPMAPAGRAVVQMDGRTDGRMDEWMDGRTDKTFYIVVACPQLKINVLKILNFALFLLSLFGKVNYVWFRTCNLLI